VVLFSYFPIILTIGIFFIWYKRYLTKNPDIICTGRRGQCVLIGKRRCPEKGTVCPNRGGRVGTRNSEYKRSCHESSIRVPTAVIGTGFTAGGQVQQLVSLIDLPPTLLDAAGIPVLETIQGRSLMPLIRRETKEWPDDVYVQISESQVGRAVRTKRWKYSVSSPDPIRNGASSELYVEEYLYDLLADPYELTNLIGLDSHRQTADVLRNRLLRRMAEAGEAPAQIITAAAAGKSGQRRVTEQEAWL